MSILVTGGAGYIGSHTCVQLLQAGHEVVVFDNFSNSHPEVLNRVEQITGRKPMLVQGDIRDQAAIESALRQHQCQAVIHFAGLKAVGESVEKPLL
ncbi:SDR family NAD(P)-dependent oxidoreductase, partial [Burkholderia sp. BC1]